MSGEPRPVVVEIDSCSVEPNVAGSKVIFHEYSSPSHSWLAGIAKKFQPSFEMGIPITYLIAKSII